VGGNSDRQQLSIEQLSAVGLYRAGLGSSRNNSRQRQRRQLTPKIANLSGSTDDYKQMVERDGEEEKNMKVRKGSKKK
jgi:hypothetical protein